MKNEENLSLEALLREANEFRSTAYYDKHLDAIRVQTRDCSIWEERKNRFITIYRRNDISVNDAVGFSIKGVRHLLHEMGMPAFGSVKMADFLAKILDFLPDDATRMVRDIYAEETHLPEEIEVPQEGCSLPRYT